MKAKKFLVLNPEGEHEYTIVVKETFSGTQYSMKTSNNSMWSDHARNRVELSMLDTGNDIQFDRNLDILDYQIAYCLKILLNFNVLVDSNPHNRVKSKIVKQIKVGKI